MSNYTRSTASTIAGVNAETLKLQTAVNSKMDKSGGAFTGTVDMNEQRLINLPDATDPSEAMPLGQGLAIQEAAETAAAEAELAADRAELAASVAVQYPTEGLLAAALAVGTANVGGAKASDLAKATINVPNLKALAAIPLAERRTDIVYFPLEFCTNTGLGGFGVRWKPLQSYTSAMIGQVYSDSALNAWNGAHSNLSALYGSFSGTGCWERVVLVGPSKVELCATTFGAIASGSSLDNRFVIQKAIDLVRNSYGKGVVTIPDIAQDNYFNVSSYLIMRPCVSLIGGWSKPRIKNNTAIGGGFGDIFLTGNFHPDFTEDFTYYPITAITAPTNVIAVPSNGFRFAVGDQVFVASDKKGLTGTFDIPLYGWLNVVEAVSADTLTLRHPIDYTIDCGIAALKNEVCRSGIGAFFYQDATISSLTIESVGKFSNDSATLDCEFKDMVVRSETAIYGNTFQNTNWTNNKYFYTLAIGEQSHNSLHTKANGCTFTFIGTPISTNTGISIQEYSRDIKYIDCHIYADKQLNGALFRVINARDVVYKGGTMSMTGNGGNDVVVLGDPSNIRIDPDFIVSGNMVKNCEIYAKNCARFLRLNAQDVSTNNGVDGVDFKGVAAVDGALLVGNGACENSKLFIRNSNFESGDLAVSGVLTFTADIKSTYIHAGVSGESATVAAPLSVCRFSGLTSDGSLSRSEFLKRTFNDGLLNETAATFYMGSSVLPYERYESSLSVKSQGNNRDRKLTVYLRNDTDSTDYFLADFISPAADSGLVYELKMSLMLATNYFVATCEWLESGTALVTDSVSITGLSLNKRYALRIDSQIGSGPGDEGNASWELLGGINKIDSMIYDY